MAQGLEEDGDDKQDNIKYVRADGRVLVLKPSISSFKVQIPINRHQNLILRNREASLNQSMTSEKKDKVKQELKYKLKLLQKIDQSKPKMEAL